MLRFSAIAVRQPLSSDLQTLAAVCTMIAFVTACLASSPDHPPA
jgi:hypothetical protein